MSALYLFLNAGSSSLKFALFESRPIAPIALWRGQIDGIGAEAHFTTHHKSETQPVEHRSPVGELHSHEDAVGHLFQRVDEWIGGRQLAACGHRVVRGGMEYTQPTVITDDIIAELKKLVPLAPLHQPHNLAPIRIIKAQHPKLPQVACFDTAFHRTQPRVAQLFALPREISQQGIYRYGFHGLSYEYIASVLPSFDRQAAQGRTVVAHLGNGASLCALRAGRSIATTMSLSALDGSPMGTRCGAVDPAVVFYLMRELGMQVEQVEQLLYTQSGLLSVSIEPGE